MRLPQGSRFYQRKRLRVGTSCRKENPSNRRYESDEDPLPTPDRAKKQVTD